MNDTTPEFISIKEAMNEFAVSRSSIERRRDAARDEGNSLVYEKFFVRTKDETKFIKPTKEQVVDLNKQGRKPEWFVARSWLEKEFRTKEDTQSDSADPDKAESADEPRGLSKSDRVYEERIKDLKEQLIDARKEKHELMQFAQADKQLFADANAKLADVLAIPGLVAVKKAEQPEVVFNELPPASSEPAKPAEKKQSEGWFRSILKWPKWLP